MTDAPDRLTAALVTFLEEAHAICDDTTGGRSPAPEVKYIARQLAALPSARRAGRAAVEAARDNRYLLREPRDPGDSLQAGRELSGRALTETGIAGLLLSGKATGLSVLATEIAAYLSGPPTPLWNYAIIDAEMELSVPVPVVDGWELAVPDRDELAGLAGVPSAADYIPRRLTLHPDLYRGLAMLRRIDLDRNAHGGIMFYFEKPSWGLWQPLLALSLYKNPVLHLWAQYEVEPGRRIDKVFDHVPIEPWTLDGTTEVERVRPGDYELDVSANRRFRRFLELLGPLLGSVVAQPAKPTKATRGRADRLRRITEHFLAAGQDAYGEGDVLSELNAEATLHYVIALEALLAGGDDNKTELSRKIIQRAAVLAGADDADRKAVAATVRAAYTTRSSYAHGGETDDIDLPALRRVVRDCILARLILGDPASGETTLGTHADQALLDHALANQIRHHINEFWATVDSP